MTHSTIYTISTFRLRPIDKMARNGMSGKKYGATKKKKKQSKRQARPLSVLKLAYLHMVIDAELRNTPMPAVPKKSRYALSGLVKESGGALEWARRQANYSLLKNKN